MKLTEFPECDNVQTIHAPRITGEDENAYRVYCRQCNNEYRVGKDHRGVPRNVEWSELFFQDAVQPPHPLFYKFHGTMETA